MEYTDELINTLENNEYSRYDDFPDIELYMDQVLTYLSRETITLRKEDKLTSAMVNNYIKDGILPRTKGKKYSREHLVYLMIITRFKQILSVKDTGKLLANDMRDMQIDKYYDEFMEMLSVASDSLIDSVKAQESDSVSRVALRLATVSYVNKIACEFLIDKMNEDIKE